MRGGRHNRFTVFDVMDHKGLFELNSANATSPQYVGPVEFPKMFYHPTGKTRVVQKAEILSTAFGPIKVGEQFEIISRIVHTAEEEARIRAAGWHDHPAKAVEASGGQAPPMADPRRIAELERQLATLQAQLSIAKISPPTIDEFGEPIANSTNSSEPVTME